MYLKIRCIGEAEPLRQRSTLLYDNEVKIRTFKDAEGIIENIKGFSHIILIAYSKSCKTAATYVAKVISLKGGEIKVKTNLNEYVNILHIQPYHITNDCIYSASTRTDTQIFRKTLKRMMLESMLKEAENFHGDLCAGVAIGVRTLYRASSELRCHPRDKELTAIVAVKGCVADGIQGPMGATNKRFRRIEPIDGTATFTYKKHTVKLKLAQSTKFNNAREVLKAKEEEVIGSVEVLTA